MGMGSLRVTISSQDLVMKSTRRRAIAISFSLFCSANLALAQTAGGPPPLEHFELHVRPLLVDNCIKCHSGSRPKGALRLDTLDAILTGGDSGPAVVAGDPGESLLVSALRYETFEMPPNAPLREKEIASIERWIEQGAVWPTDTRLTTDQSSERLITDEDRNHWSFRPVRVSAPPIDASDHWSRNPVDRFVFQKLAEEGLRPAPEADRRTLIRRVFFDVLGLPPTIEQISQFVDDPAVDAYEKLVERLLSNPAYGERWARHWLDLVRYGESDGYRADGYRKNAWRYRDYVIQSFNDDKPYDRFIREQLAGDELYPEDPKSLVGTGFLRLPLYEYNQRDVITQRQDILNDITDVTADVFLGLGMKCARCHDHKFDPILQLDYFRLQAHFAALYPRDDTPLLSPVEFSEYQAREEEWLAATKSIRDQITAIRKPYLEKQFGAVLSKFSPDIKRIFDIPQSERTPLERQLMYFVDRQKYEEGKQKLSNSDAERVKALEDKLQAFAHLKPPPIPRAATVTDVGCVAPVTAIDGRSEVSDVMPLATEVVSDLVPAPIPAASENSTGRRAALADWLTEPSHPLTSRVAINRIWQYHFGRGLVTTSSDFGSLGGEPTHPKLLDWLANRFIEDGWSWKSMHRLMLNSATYRQSAHHPNAEDCRQIDAANDLRWRWDIRRLSAEQVVDAILKVSGQVEERVGGASENGSSARRAIYRKVYRNKQDRLLALFDFPDGINSAPSRSVTTTPTQALALLNHEWGWKAARAMAERLSRESEVNDCESTVRRAYELAFARLPSPAELRLALDFLMADANESERTSHTACTVDGLTQLCHAILNTNEFVYVD